MPCIVMTRILKTVLHFMDQSQMTSQQDFVINFNYEWSQYPLPDKIKKKKLKVGNCFSCIWNEYYSDSYPLKKKN